MLVNNSQMNCFKGRLLVAISSLAFILFLYLRFNLVPLGYHFWDENAFKKASATLVYFPPREYYQKISLAEVGYLPLIPLILWVAGTIYRFTDPLFSPDSPINSSMLYFLKFPAILFDVLIAIAIYFLLKKRGKVIGFLGACLYFINPAFIYISSYWGQFESVYGFMLLLTLIFLQSNNYQAVFLMFSVSLLAKPQSILAYPIILIYMVYFKRLKIKKLLSYSILGLTPFLIILPFVRGNPAIWLLNYFQKLTSSSTSPYISSALNFWWLITNRPTPFGDKFGLFSYKMWAVILYGAFYILVLLKLVRNLKVGNDWLIEALFLAYLGYFNLASQVHERYLYPAILFLYLLIWKRKGQLVALPLLTLTFLVNIFTAWPEFPSFFAIFKIPPVSQLMEWLVTNRASRICLMNLSVFLLESIILFSSPNDRIFPPDRKHK